MKSIRVILSACLPPDLPALAAVPTTLSYQGTLRDLPMSFVSSR